MAKLDIHALLKEYHGMENYPEIIQYALEYQGESAELILSKVNDKYEHMKPVLGVKDNAPVNHIFGIQGVDIDMNAVNQFYTALKVLPTTRGALMPDAHYGYALPIGGVVEYRNAIFPAGVGYDIGCQVMFTELDITEEDVENNKQEFFEILDQESYLGLGARREEPVLSGDLFNLPVWDDLYTKEEKESARYQLATLGSGNHFIDLMVGEYVDGRKFVALVTHAGSRKIGYNTAKKYSELAQEYMRKNYRKVPDGYGWLDMNTDLGKEYYKAMVLMVNFATMSHNAIHTRIIRLMGTERKKRILSVHNTASREGNKYVHRKGATPAKEGQLGIIPGTSGTTSYIILGRGNKKALNSSSHGAGRPFSRTEAKEKHSEEDFINHMESEEILYKGVAPDETFMAYKDVNRIIEIQKEEELIYVVGKMKPKIVIMGG